MHSMSASLPSYDEAAALVAARAAEILAHKPGIELVDLAAAQGRVLAQPIMADRDMPSFPRSTRDGFACRASEASTHTPLCRAASGILRLGDHDRRGRSSRS